MTHDQASLPPIKGFIESSFLDWPGYVCAVIFLPYCNLRCPYCHNHRLVLEPGTLDTLSIDDILAKLLPNKAWIDGICVTGGEPTIHRTLPALLRAIRQAGFKTKLDTNGTQPEILEILISENLVDHVAIDVKAPLDDASYARCAGVYVPTSIIRASIQVLMASRVPTTFRCTAAPSLLTEADLCRLAEDLRNIWAQIPSVDKPVPHLVLQNFNPADAMEPALREEKPFDDQIFDGLQNRVDQILAPLP
jgi:pyruvate formate lyase activating enzyme